MQQKILAVIYGVGQCKLFAYLQNLFVKNYLNITKNSCVINLFLKVVHMQLRKITFDLPIKLYPSDRWQFSGLRLASDLK